MYSKLYTSFFFLYWVFHLARPEQDNFEYEFYPACLNNAEGLFLNGRRLNDLQPSAAEQVHAGKKVIKIKPGEKHSFIPFKSPYMVSRNSSCRLTFALDVGSETEFSEIKQHKLFMDYYITEWISDRCETTIGIFLNKKSIKWIDCENTKEKEQHFSTEYVDDLLAIQYNITVGADPVTSETVQTARFTVVGAREEENDEAADKARLFYYIVMGASAAFGIICCIIKCCIFGHRASAARNSRNARNTAMGSFAPPVNAQGGDSGQGQPPPGNTPLTGNYGLQPSGFGYGMNSQPAASPEPPPPYSSLNPDKGGQETQWTRV